MNGTRAHSRFGIRNLGRLVAYLVLALRYRSFRRRWVLVDPDCHFSLASGSELALGRRVRFQRGFVGEFAANAAVRIGDRVSFSRGCHVSVHSGLEIGDYSLFGEYVSIHDEDHKLGRSELPLAERGFETAPIRIGRNVWVGAKATILKGVTIGDDAVIGAHAVVTRDVPAGAVAVGIPARVLRSGGTRP
jgi:acetyltransferase-like isoleucine patch superfamily enzyme